MAIISTIMLFLISILPGILWVRYFYKKDRYHPEPKLIIIRDFIAGMFAVLPASIIESPFSGLISNPPSLLILFLSTIFIVGFVEEGIKSILVYILHFKHPEFDEPLDGIIYGVTVGLGFAAAENLFYTIMYGYEVGLARAVITSLAHASFTGIFGFYLTQSRQYNNKHFIFFGFILVSFMHGLYDFLVISQLISFITTIIIIAALQIYLAYLIENLLIKAPFDSK